MTRLTRRGFVAATLAGGVALNCVANGRILREGPFERLWVQPASGDAGGALGVALLIHHQLLENPRVPGHPDGQSGSLLGPGYSDEEIERLGRTLMLLDEKMTELRTHFGLSAEDLNLDLGPLGRLL